ncbi:hypothetical protein DFH09DRAFT_1050008 [Mycena vulgaris]|nr:hypothetical protein DFH09DRAFT_1050008 [Mycena vulgaris]
MIHGGTFISAENVHHRHGEAGIQILHRSVALEALYDSAESFPQPRCHPDTRTEMLEGLYNWAIADNSSRSIRWLHGPAGAGKSAIMQSLCQRLQDAGRLGGSFFFKRHHTTRGNAKVLFATLAYQLALNNRHLKPLISKVVEDDPSVMARHMGGQVHKLVVEPCQALNDDASPILLIDGLDECEGHDVQQEILRVLGNVAQNHLLRLRILIASRPELHIRDRFEHSNFQGLYDSVNVRQSFEDIWTYLRDEFKRIQHKHRQTMDNIPIPWPSPETLDKLVEKSSGYFIYASTLVKFIDDEDSRPAERLEVIQDLATSEYDLPFDALDQLYMQILLGVPYRYRSKLCDILCVVTNFEFCTEEIERLLHLQPGDVLLILRRLHSLLDVPSTSNAYAIIHVHHASFPDFLHNSQRSSIFYVGSEHRIKVARSVLEALPGVGYDVDIEFAWKAGNLRDHWATFLQSVPPSTELLPLIQSVSPDFIWERSLPELFGQRTNSVLTWLKTVRPLPEDLIRDWEAYRFMEFYEYSNHNTHASLLNVRDAIAQGCPDHVVLSPSLQVSRTFQAEMDDSLQMSTHALRELFAQFPQLVRFFQARRLLSNNRSYVSEPFGVGLFNICVLLDIPWNDMKDALSSLRSIVDEDPRKIATMLMVLPTLCRELPEHTSRDLGLGFLRLIRQIGDHELPLKIWELFTWTEIGQFPEWGRHIRCSPHSSSELLHAVREFDPPLDWFSVWDMCELHLCPVDFHDVLQWLKTFADPPLDLVVRWEGYLREAQELYEYKYSDDELEERWQKSGEKEAGCDEWSGPLEREVIKCWKISVVLTS